MATKHPKAAPSGHILPHAALLDDFVQTVTQPADFPDHALSWALDGNPTRGMQPRFMSAPGLPDDLPPRHETTWLWLARPRPQHPLSGDPLRALAPLLSAAEQDRASRLRFAADRWSYCTAHAGLRVLLAQALGTQPLDVAFTVSTVGKPALDPLHHTTDACRDLHFNISHTRGMVAVVLAPQPAGVDVEPVRPLRDMRELVTTLMAPEALAAFDAARDDVDRIELFFRYWTLGEAFIKATGLGLDQGLDSFAFNPDGQPRLTRVTPGWGSPGRWSLGHARARARQASA